jgi:hypothetical protein
MNPGFLKGMNVTIIATEGSAPAITDLKYSGMIKTDRGRVQPLSRMQTAALSASSIIKYALHYQLFALNRMIFGFISQPRRKSSTPNPL